MFTLLLSVLSLIMFAAAAAAGVRTVQHGSTFYPIVIYGTIVAGLNALFRAYTVFLRASALPERPVFPQPFTTNAALVLQVGIATFFLISLAYAFLVVREVEDVS